MLYDENKQWHFNGLAWFRLKFNIDTSLVSIPLDLELNHYGASEIYIDGKLIHKYGEINKPDFCVYYDPQDVPLVFSFNKSGLHLIAIRYANYHAIRNYKLYDDPMAGFEIRLNLANSAIDIKSINNVVLSSIFMMLASLFFSFSLIHFFMFLLNSSIKSNLYFSVFMFCLTTCFVIGLISYTVNNVELQLLSAYLLIVSNVLSFVALSGFINELFSKNKKRFIFISVFGFLALVLQYLHHDQYGNLITALILFILLEAIFVVSKAIVQKVKGAWIIGTGILFFTIFIFTAVIISLVNSSEITIENSSTIGQIIIVCVILTIISIPLSMSIYLAWNFSSINKNLSLQLEQVKRLSEKNLEQEQEKQRILENKRAELEVQVLARTSELREEKKKSDDLLLNILPAEIAEELKQKGSAVARDYDKVTVMFTDFKDFTKISEQLTPSELVKEIDFCFSAFDHIIQKYNIEKIKTIGDAYMCVGGLPIPSETHAQDVVNAAIEIRDFMDKHNLEKKLKGEHQFRIRIGIHTGSVVAGIVGVKKFAYDIWGDTVNIASRIESSGEPAKVNISGSTYEIVKNHFNFNYRGKIEAKNKGQIDMYFVEKVRY
jgi:class 3 adenylate cyclase